MSPHRVTRPAVEQLEGRALPAVSLVADINPNGSSEPHDLVSAAGTLFFAADDDNTGNELWKTDGTTAGTVLVKDINSGDDDANPSNLTSANGALFFFADDDSDDYGLWRSDGTTAGTTQVRGGFDGGPEQEMVNVNGTLFFRADDNDNGPELWKSDGTPGGTVLVKDIRSGLLGSTPRSLTNVNGTLFFAADDGNNGIELWKSDGTPEGTVLVKDITVGDSNPTQLTNVNGTLFFAAANGGTGVELWKSDGTDAGTVLVRDINTSGLVSTLSSFPSSLANINGTLFFTADDGNNGRELWKSNGTLEGTVLVKDINPGGGSSDATAFADVNGTAFFRANDGNTGQELWKSNGTPEGTVLVKDINSGALGSVPRSLINVNGTLFFGTDEGDPSDGELWSSDGTEAGTVLVQDIAPGDDDSDPDHLTNVNGTIFFSADGPGGRELWKATTSSTSLSPGFAVGGADGTVRLLNATTGALLTSFRPLDTGSVQYTGLVQVALGDMNGDAVADLLVAAASPAGQQGLDPTKAGRVFVFDGTSLSAGLTPSAPIRDFVPFATTDGPLGTTGAYINGLNIAVADVNADSRVDLVAGTRGGSSGAGLPEFGRFVVIDGTSPAGTNTVIGGIVKPFGNGYEKGVVVAAGDLNGDGNDEIGVTRGGPVASPNPETQKIKLKAFQLQGTTLAELPLSGTGSPLAPFGSLTGPANAINRDGRVAFVDTNGDGSDELIFTALDPLTDPANKQVRIVAYSVNIFTGLATVVSTGPDAGTYLTGSAVVDHAITAAPASSNLALLTESATSGLVYLAPLTGAEQPGGFALSILNGGITIDGI